MLLNEKLIVLNGYSSSSIHTITFVPIYLELTSEANG